MQGGTVSLRLSVREVERKEWLGGGGDWGCVRKTQFPLPDH